MNRFTFNYEERKFEMKADSEEIRERWLNALQFLSDHWNSEVSRRTKSENNIVTKNSG